MEAMADGIRRSHARLRCDLPAEIFLGAAAGRSMGAARVLDLSLSGALLGYDGELQRGTPYRLRVDGIEGPFEMPLRVVREGPRGKPGETGARRYGAVFNLSADQERLLRLLLDRVRRNPPTDAESRFDRSLRDYWSS